MNKKSLITIFAVFIIMLGMTFGCFAADDAFKLKSSYPRDGQENTSVENVGVKLYFSHPVSGEKAKTNNAGCVKIVDGAGKRIPIKVLTDDGDSGLVLVLADSTDKTFKVKGNSEYQLVIDKGFMDNEGNTIGEDKTITFKTYNQNMSNYINMGMMALMFGGIMIMTLREQNKKKEEKEAESKGKGEKNTFNPYKEAKKTGKSYEEVVAAERKRQERLAKKTKRKKEEPGKKELDLGAILTNVYHVSEPQPIAAAGGKYKKERVVLREEKVKKAGTGSKKK